MSATHSFKNDQNSGEPEASLPVEQNAEILKFERPDWTLFRTVEGLQQKAGVPAKLLRRLVIKELADNALDAGSSISVGYLGDDDCVYVEDNGPGLDGSPEEIADLFSIRRPMRSTKLLRLPQRGALGNGLRVVAGAVLASSGMLFVITRNQRIELRPQSDGSTAVVEVTEADYPIGTRIEIGFGPALPSDPAVFFWARAARFVAPLGQNYQGKSSPHWYDAAQFHELILASGSQPVRSLIAQLDGCTGGKAGDIVSAADLDRMLCERVTREQATKLLTTAREETRPVSPDRLGSIGRDAFPAYYYAAERGTVRLGSSQPQADIPFVVEAWAQKRESGDKINIDLFINKTPNVDEIVSWRDSDKDLWLRGSGIKHYTQNAPKKGAFDIKVNVTTPYMPITSDGKAPNLEPFVEEIMSSVVAAMNRAHRAAPKQKKATQKDVVINNLDAVIADVSGNGKFRFNARQLFYALRPIVKKEIDEELQIGNFTGIITDYEAEKGEIAAMYREPRGSITHPHRDETITLGTLMVEEYERPIWTFNKLLFIEKEGANEALKAVRWLGRHDCAVISSKGFSSRAARDLIDKLAEHDEPIQVFCAHDADAFGTMIYQTLQEATKARGARKIEIINIGLEPWEGIAMGLEVETVKRAERRKAVAQYVLDRDDYAPDRNAWEEWLQTHRIELNAMTTPQFITWLDGKMAAHGVGKLVPPGDVIKDELEERLEAKLRDSIRERILREAGFENQVTKALDAIERPSSDELIDGIREYFKDNQEDEWRDHIEEVADDLTRN
jgi:hypothetical protein